MQISPETPNLVKIGKFTWRPKFDYCCRLQ